MTDNDGMDDLRALIREVIRDQLGRIRETELVETVNLSTDADLAAFVSRLLSMDEQAREEVRAGRKRFRLAAPAPAPAPALAPAGGGAGTVPAGQAVRRIDKGAVTESVIKDAARAGQRLVLGPAAVLTPLARDRARASGVQVEKER
ncbi:MAG TPA: hypothetical protein VGG16_08530 [Streptosporangiaceae bacterium]